MNIKKLVMTGLAVTLMTGLTACGGKDKKAESTSSSESASKEVVSSSSKDASKEDKSITVFAAASLTDALDEISANYKKDNPNLEILFSYDSSGTLASQIEEGAACDIFISAAQKQMNELEEKDLINKDTRVDLLENKVVLAKAKDKELDIKDFKDLTKVDSIALGNSDVPVGQYSEEILKNLGIWDEIQDKITFGSNVREVATWINEQAADCGIIYETDAKIYDLDIIQTADDSMLENKVTYPMAELKDTKEKEEADKFMEYLNSDSAKEVFVKYGFTTLK